MVHLLYHSCYGKCYPLAWFFLLYVMRIFLSQMVVIRWLLAGKKQTKCWNTKTDIGYLKHERNLVGYWQQQFCCRQVLPVTGTYYVDDIGKIETTLLSLYCWLGVLPEKIFSIFLMWLYFNLMLTQIIGCKLIFLGRGDRSCNVHVCGKSNTSIR